MVFNPNQLVPDNIDRLSTALIPQNSKILELGSGPGHMSRYFKQKLHCRVINVDINSQAKPEIIGDLDDKTTWQKIKQYQPFDLVFASAVIEHLKYPELTLQLIKSVLKPKGQLIITTSNVAHWRNRLNLLLGRWQYQDYGTLDRTHLKFYTYFTFQSLVKNAGFKILSVKIDPAGGIKYFNFIAKHLPNFYAHQILVQAVKA